MTGKTGIAIVLLVSFLSSSALAYEGEHGEKNMVVGGNLSLGFAMAAGDGYEEINDAPIIGSNINRDNRTAKFATGGDVYFDFYFTPMFAVEAGFGFSTTGIRFSDGSWTHKVAMTQMQIPICFKVDFHHFQGAVGLALFVSLSAYTKDTVDNEEQKTRWEDEQWQYVHRANLGPKLSFSYAIPVGPVFIVPGISWFMHLINDIDNDEVNNDYNLDGVHNMRANTLMFNIGAEWAF